jgi:HNH endonuclease
MAQPVEWILAIYYGPSAHRATYGRLDGSDTKYTKDYIQLSKKVEFLDALRSLFPLSAGESGFVPITYQWPLGTTPGALVFNSADRPHLKWETSRGAPRAWKMSPSPNETTAETIPGDPSQLDFNAAENELALLASRGAGQPYLLAIKIAGESRRLHIRVYLKNPSPSYSWADIEHAPLAVQNLVNTTSQRSALASSLFQSGGVVPSQNTLDAVAQLNTSDSPLSKIDAFDSSTSRSLADYLRQPSFGLFFDPNKNHDAWIEPVPLSPGVVAACDALVQILEKRLPATSQENVANETVEVDPDEVAVFRRQIEQHHFAVADSTSTVKTRGSAQKVFAEAVKGNYGYRCAITGISTKDFLVASHIVPWSQDQSIRLDPSNGLCLSLIVDLAFEKGYLQIDDELTVRIDWRKIGDDQILERYLRPYDGQKLSMPSHNPPKQDYLQRRRMLHETT